MRCLLLFLLSMKYARAVTKGQSLTSLLLVKGHSGVKYSVDTEDCEVVDIFASLFFLQSSPGAGGPCIPFDTK